MSLSAAVQPNRRTDHRLPGSPAQDGRGTVASVTDAQDRWDLVVVGAGPAGATTALAALAARPSARVLLLDRSDFPRDKPCGDGVAPQALDVWAGLGVDDVVTGYRAVHRLTLRGTTGAAATHDMRRPAHVVPRRVLDARLVEAAVAAGAVLRCQRVRTVRAETDQVVVDGTVRAEVVVGADGPGSVVRRSLGLPDQPPGHAAVAMRAYCDVPDEVPTEQAITMDSQRWPAYAWSFPIGDGTANVGYGVLLTGTDRPTRTDLLDGLRRGVPWAGTLRDVRGHLLPLSSWRPSQPDGRVLLAGDALSLVNPTSGEGIYYAALSGRCAGRSAMLADDPGRAYRRALRAALGRHHRDVGAVARLSRRPALVDAGIRAGAARGPVFDDLVEMALADGALTARLLRAVVSQLISPPRPRSTRAATDPGVH